MIANDDYEDQEEITDVSWRSLILAADRERTVDKLDCNIFYVVTVGLMGFPCWNLIEVQGIEDTVEDEIAKYRNVDSIGNRLLVNEVFRGYGIAASGRLQHRSKIVDDAIFKNRGKSEMCTAVLHRGGVL